MMLKLDFLVHPDLRRHTFYYAPFNNALTRRPTRSPAFSPTASHRSAPRSPR